MSPGESMELKLWWFSFSQMKDKISLRSYEAWVSAWDCSTVNNQQPSKLKENLHSWAVIRLFLDNKVSVSSLHGIIGNLVLKNNKI